eukprot:TRINITY_DN166_c0_g1_i9.p1 TRINITY_DN166_c0_g1~~TRINITY_DN166_c0_g1_i9.p1  ORF type:complete len:197 (-),score=2.81 TRINITY_DN166_c0_g1_i9:161-751(-)
MRTVSFIIIAALYCCGLAYPAYNRCDPQWVLKIQDDYDDCSRPGAFTPRLSWSSEVTIVANILYSFGVKLPIDHEYRIATPLTVYSYYGSLASLGIEKFEINSFPQGRAHEINSWMSRGAAVVAIVKSNNERVIITHIKSESAVYVLDSQGRIKDYELSKFNDVFTAYNKKLLGQTLRISFLSQSVVCDLFVRNKT